MQWCVQPGMKLALAPRPRISTTAGAAKGRPSLVRRYDERRLLNQLARTVQRLDHEMNFMRTR